MTRTRRRWSSLSLNRLEDILAPVSAGSLDPTFDLDGRLTAPHANPAGFTEVAAMADGRIVAVSSTRTGVPLTDSASLVARFLPDGSPDPSFSGDGLLTVPMSVAGVAVRQDGTVLLGGVWQQTPGWMFAAAHVSPDGSEVAVESRFVTVQPREAPRAAAVNPATGDIYVAGDTGVARFSADLDFLGERAFGTGGTDTVYDMAVDPAGRLYLVGLHTDFIDPRVPFWPPNSPPPPPLTTTTGFFRTMGLDLTDLPATPDMQDVATVAVDLATGAAFTAGDGTPNSIAVRRVGGSTVYSQPQSGGPISLAVDGKGRVLLLTKPAGTLYAQFQVTRLLPEALTPDPEFNGTGVAAIDFGEGATGYDITADGADRVVVAGAAGEHPVLARLLGTGDEPVPPGPNPNSDPGPNPDPDPDPGPIPGEPEPEPEPVPELPPPVRELIVSGPDDGSVQMFSPSAEGVYAPAGSSVRPMSGFVGAVLAAVADVTGDGITDSIIAAGRGGGPRVAVIDGRTGATVVDFFAFEPTFFGGLFVASADLDGDDRAEVIVGPGEGGGPIVAVYSGAALAAGRVGDAAQLVRFKGIADETFRGGVRVAAGDLNGDGVADVAVAAGAGGGPRVALFDGRDIATGSADPRRLVNDFFAFQQIFRGGVYLAAGDVDGDGYADLALGAGNGGAPRVQVISGRAIMTAEFMPSVEYTPTGDPGSYLSGHRLWSLTVPPGLYLASLFAGDQATRSGVRVALRDSDGDGRTDLVTGSGAGEPGRVRLYRTANLLGSAAPLAEQELDPFGVVVANGVFVG